MAFKTWSAGEVLNAAQLNGNFALCVRTDAAKTISASHIWNAAQKFQDGSAAAPTLTNDGDVDTGIFWPTANAIGLAAGGSEVARITTNGLRAGDVGEGTLADARLSNNVPLLDQANPFTALQSVQRGTANGVALQLDVSGDSETRFRVNADGQMSWGSGSAARDTNLYRSNPDVLRTDDAFVVGDTLAWGGGSAISSSDDVLTSDSYIVDGWQTTDISASFGPSAVGRFESTATAFAVSAIRAGSLIGLTAKLSGTISAGTITVEVYIDGSATGLNLTFGSGDGADPVKQATQAVGTDSISAGDAVDVRVSSDGSLSPSTIDMVYAGVEIAI